MDALEALSQASEEFEARLRQVGDLFTDLAIDVGLRLHNQPLVASA